LNFDVDIRVFNPVWVYAVITLSHMITVALLCRKLASAGTHRTSVYSLKFMFCERLISLLLTFVTAFSCYIPSSVKWRISFRMIQFLSHNSLYFSIVSSLWVNKMYFSNYSHF